MQTIIVQIVRKSNNVHKDKYLQFSHVQDNNENEMVSIKVMTVINIVTKSNNKNIRMTYEKDWIECFALILKNELTSLHN